MFFMIKKKIDLNFHVNFTDKLNNTNYLYGSVFQKYEDDFEYALYNIQIKMEQVEVNIIRH